jgi:titin
VEIDGPNNTVGGTTANTGDVISGNVGDGVLITGTNATGNLVARNIIGADLSGFDALANGLTGVEVNGAGQNTIGGPFGVAGNLLSGNSSRGVYLNGASNNQVLGNLIGVALDGVHQLANGTDGVVLLNGAANNTIGAANGWQNIISGNTDSGVVLSGTNITGNQIASNVIGLDANGNQQGNGQYGVYFNGGASRNTVGGTTAGSGNIISGNTSDGVRLSDAGTIQNIVAGDFIGTNIAGTSAKGPNGNPTGNGGNGVTIINCSNNTIGALAAGTNAMLTVISGNGRGVSADLAGVDLSNASNNLVINCYIGTDMTGLKALPNLGFWVHQEARSSFNTIGGLGGVATRNMISGNSSGGTLNRGFGVAMMGFSVDNLVEGNYIGVGSDGKTAVGNDNEGVDLEAGSNNNTIGGPVQQAGNVISANGFGEAGFGGYGIELHSNNNDVDWNFLGRDATGNDQMALHNQNGASGSIDNNGTGNTIGSNNKLQLP